MLLKGIGEVETAPDRRAAAEMVLIRLCHVADLPSPGDLVRRLNAAPGAAGGAGIVAPAAAAVPRRPAAVLRRPVAGRRAPGAPPSVAAPAPWHGGAGNPAAPDRARPPARNCEQFPRRRRPGGGAAGGDAARPPAALGAPGALRPAGDRAAPAAGCAARPGVQAGGAAHRGDRHPLDHRAVHRAGRSPPWPNRATPRTPNAVGGGAPPAGAGDPGRLSRRPDRRGARLRGPTPTGCRTSRCSTPPPMPPDMPDFAPPDAEPSEDMEFDA